MTVGKKKKEGRSRGEVRERRRRKGLAEGR
jgi:hypothetical protein